MIEGSDQSPGLARSRLRLAPARAMAAILMMRVMARPAAQPTGSPSLPSDLRARFAPLLEGAEEELLAEVRGDPPIGLAQIDEATEHNLRVGVRAAIEQLFRKAEGSPGSDDRQLYLAHGRAQRLAGRSLDEMLGFYRLGALVVWRRAARLGGPGGLNAEQMTRLADTFFALAHDLSAAVSRGYAEAPASQAEIARHRRQELFSLLLRAPRASSAAVERLAATLAWPIAEPILVLVTGAHTDALAVHHEVLSGPHDDHLGLLIPADRAAWHLASLERSLASGGPSARAHATDWHEVPDAFRHAALALRLARAGAIPEAPVIDAERHAALLLIAGDRPLAARLAADRLGAFEELSAPDAARLLDTLAAWLDAPGRSQAVADRLGVHAQTVRYRLRQLRDLLDDDLDDPDARFELAVALRARRIECGRW